LLADRNVVVVLSSVSVLLLQLQNQQKWNAKKNNYCSCWWW